MPKVEELRSAWIDATDPAEQKRLGSEIQLQAFRDVAIRPAGRFLLCRRLSKEPHRHTEGRHSTLHQHETRLTSRQVSGLMRVVSSLMVAAVAVQLTCC
jgi:hypothetical protein